MRLLCSTTPMEGVFAPVVPLATALARDGHEVLVATAPDLIDRVRATGLDAVLAGPSASESVARALADPEFAAGEQPWRIGAVMFARIMAAEKLPALRAIAKEFAPDLVLHPPVDLAAPLLAAGLGVPSITYGTGLLLEPELVAAMAGWVKPLWLVAGLEPDDNAGLYRHGYLNPVPPSLQPDLGPAAGRARAVRPTVPGSAEDGLPSWAEGLGNRPVVYVSLGTVPIFNQPETFAPILEALGTEDVDVIVTVGNTNDPADFGQLPDNIHLHRWLPPAAVLPLCDAVVCHGGAGTTLAALAHGLPLVLLPRGADQFPTAAACRRAGAAQVITPQEITAAAVRNSVQAVLRDSEHRDAAKRLQQEIEAMPSVESVARELAR
jgi:UDP:flavonoid glycosyltransferase YjiC (YdhE family)